MGSQFHTGRGLIIAVLLSLGLGQHHFAVLAYAQAILLRQGFSLFGFQSYGHLQNCRVDPSRRQLRGTPNGCYVYFQIIGALFKEIRQAKLLSC